jgi:hypothetical protein
MEDGRRIRFNDVGNGITLNLLDDSSEIENDELTI